MFESVIRFMIKNHTSKNYRGAIALLCFSTISSSFYYLNSSISSRELSLLWKTQLCQFLSIQPLVEKAVEYLGKDPTILGKALVDKIQRTSPQSYSTGRARFSTVFPQLFPQGFPQVRFEIET